MQENKKEKYFSKEYWKTNWKFILVNIAIFLGALFIFLLIDQLTKEYIFRWKDKSILSPDLDYEIGNKFIIFKSVFHAGTTLGFFESNLPVLHTFSFAIILGSLWGVTFVREKHSICITIFLGLVSAGSMGNMIDRFIFGGVRDIMNFPWANQGVLNFADIWLVLGAISVVLSIITIHWIKHYKKNKLTKDENKV
ncbi:signal peptidase II [Mycoplasma sp. 2575]